MDKSLAKIGTLALALGACADSGPAGEPSQADAGQVWFHEEAGERGLDFLHRSGHSGRFLYPEIIAGGAALFDMDGDGDLDAYLVQAGSVIGRAANTHGNQLFENDGEGNFRDISAQSGAADRGYGMGVASGDYDRDGDLDLYVTNLGSNVLLRNDGGGQFTDVSEASGSGEELWSSSASFIDYDRDGDLDLWVVNYLFWTLEEERECYNQATGNSYCGPKAYNKPAPDTLYRNNGDGSFSDVSLAMGLRKALGNGLGVGVSDVNLDGFDDVFVANDGTMDHLWINQAGTGFVEQAVPFGCAVDQDGKIKAGMGVAFMDFDGDRDEELLVVNLKGEYDSFFQNEGNRWLDRTASIGLNANSSAYTRFGVGWADFDNDGHLDLFEANGGVAHAAETGRDKPFAQLNLVYQGAESGRFKALKPIGATPEPLAFASRGAAFGDVNGDGAVDVLVVNRDAPAHLLINHAPDRGNWISFTLSENRSASLGAVLSFRAGTRQFTRRVRTSTSYCSASDPRIHVGLGALAEVTEVKVFWPDGSSQSFGSLRANQEHQLPKTQ
jgi:hypothetical protein